MTGSLGGFARLWSVHTGEVIGPPFYNGSSVRSVAFDSEGRRIATSGVRAVHVFALREEESDMPDDLEQWVEVLTGQRMDENGATGPIDADEWRRLRARTSRPFTRSVPMP